MDYRWVSKQWLSIIILRHKPHYHDNTLDKVTQVGTSAQRFLFKCPALENAESKSKHWKILYQTMRQSAHVTTSRHLKLLNEFSGIQCTARKNRPYHITLSVIYSCWLKYIFIKWDCVDPLSVNNLSFPTYCRKLHKTFKLDIKSFFKKG